jgi:MYXO-CTERM domain-containing protein
MVYESYGYVGFDSGTGSLTQSGGPHSVFSLWVGYDGFGDYNLSGSGQLSAVRQYIGENLGNGSVTQSGGTDSVGSLLLLGYDSGSTGTYNLNGGLLALSGSGLAQGSGSATFNFGGGTLGALAPWSSFVNMNLTGIGGNGVVDTTGGSISLSGNLTGSGGLTKIGAGTLILSAGNSYWGGTTVDAGTLVLACSDSIADGSSLTIGANVFSTSDVAIPRTAAPAPEPSTPVLLAAWGIVAAVVAWRRRRN